MLVVILSVITFAAVFSTSSSENQTVRNSEAPSNIVSSVDIKKGIDSKREEFESIDIEFPDENKITYERDENGKFTSELDSSDLLLWNVVESLSPSLELTKQIGELVVYYDYEDSSSASVQSINDDNSLWSIEINYAAVEDFEEFVPTVIHEYAHILSLQDSQTVSVNEASDISQSCATLLLAEGCLSNDSYLNGFYKSFWSALPEEESTREKSLNEAASYFEMNQNDFVSEYATTNTIEDFAESYRSFVLDDRSTKETVASMKINFLYNFADLAQYRLSIRQTIAGWAQ